MAITHAKTDSITDWTQADLDTQIALGNFPSGTVLANIVLPSDWNAAHTIANATITNAMLVNGAVANLSGTNTGDQTSVSGNAGTATALQNARTIGAVSFDGTANIVPQTIESANEATDTTCFPLFITASGTQQLQPKNNTGLTYNSNTNSLAATTFVGALTGTASGNATTALDNLGSVAINASLVLATSDTFALGSTTKQWSDIFLAEGGVINWDNGDATLTQVGDVVTLAGADLKVATAGNASTSVLTTDATQTVTNKTIIASSNVVAEITAITDSATPTPTGGSLQNNFDVTALGQAATFAAPSGSPANWNKLIIRIKDNGTARALSWNAIYTAGGVALPTTTVLSKILTLGFIYNTANALNKWCLLASAQEA